MSSHHLRGDALLNKVEELVQKYQNVAYPSAVLHKVLKNPDSFSILASALRRQVFLAKCRSQDWKDGQITIYDRALLILSNYGEDPTDPGAMELYLTEFLGVVPLATVQDGNETVSKHLELQNLLDQSVESKDVENAAAPSEEYKREEEQERDELYRPYLHHFDDDEAKFRAESERNDRAVQVRVERLLEVYRQAKNDYLTTKERDGVDSLSAVRFLRDTAENALRYLHANHLSHHPRIPELEDTFMAARDKTSQILGGRKRHFDYEPSYRKRRTRRPPPQYRRPIDSYRPDHESSY